MIGRIRRLHVRDKLSEREIARMTGLSRDTVPKYWRESRPNKLSAFEATLKQALMADARRPKQKRHTTRALHAEIKVAGYGGGYSAVTDFVRVWRQGEGQAVNVKAFVPLNFDLGRGLPVRLERRRPGRRRHLLLPRAGAAPEAVREPRVLVGGLPKKIAGLDPVKKISCSDKARLIAGLRQQHKLTDLLHAACLARSTFYCPYHAVQRANPQSAMEPRIRAVYDEHKGRYGYRRITAALCNSMAQPLNHKCVQRLMQKMGLHAVIRAKKRSRHVPGISDAHVPNVLERDFYAAAPNQKWVTDVTEFNVKGQKLYPFIKYLTLS